MSHSTIGMHQNKTTETMATFSGKETPTFPKPKNWSGSWAEDDSIWCGSLYRHKTPLFCDIIDIRPRILPVFSMDTVLHDEQPVRVNGTVPG